MEWPETVSPCIKTLRKEFLPGLSPLRYLLMQHEVPLLQGLVTVYSARPCGEKRRKESKGEERKREIGNRGHGERKERTVHLLWLPVSEETSAHSGEGFHTNFNQPRANQSELRSIRSIMTWGRGTRPWVLCCCQTPLPRLAPQIVPLWPPPQPCTPAASQGNFPCGFADISLVACVQ